LLFLSSLLSVMVGVLMAILPGTGALALAWLIGSYTMVLGILLLALALRLRSWQSSH
jgi:uncharacterized membrane protein HdeD (DUF308 family)